MYLHLGNNTVVNDRDIIGIFDMDNTTISKHTRKYLSHRTKDNQVVNVSMDLPKSYIVCSKKGKVTVYVSQLSPKTLQKRENILKKL